MTDAELLAIWMERQGNLTQSQAAEILGIKQPSVNAVLSGKNALSGSGRKFVEHLLADIEQPTAEKKALIKIAQISLENLPEEYLSNEYLFNDVG